MGECERERGVSGTSPVFDCDSSIAYFYKHISTIKCLILLQVERKSGELHAMASTCTPRCDCKLKANCKNQYSAFRILLARHIRLVPAGLAIQARRVSDRITFE